MLFSSDAASLIQVLRVVDSSDSAVTGIAFDDADLQVSYKLQAGSAFVSPTLVEGTIGTYLANSWVEISDGLYQWCPPAAAVVANTSTVLRLTYDGFTQYDTIEPKLTSSAEIASIASSVAAYAARLALEVQLQGFPSAICRNADYAIETESEIRITLEDLAGEAITEIAGTPVAGLSFTFGMGTERHPNLITGTCSFDSLTSELVIEIPATETDGKSTGSLTWHVGVTIDEKSRWLGGGTTRLIERQF